MPIQIKGHPVAQCEFESPTTREKKEKMQKCVDHIKKVEADRESKGQTCSTHMGFVAKGKQSVTILTLICDGRTEIPDL